MPVVEKAVFALVDVEVGGWMLGRRVYAECLDRGPFWCCTLVIEVKLWIMDLKLRNRIELLVNCHHKRWH